MLELPGRSHWNIACISYSTNEHLHEMCDGGHRHAPGYGEEALYAQGLAQEICEENKAMHVLVKTVIGLKGRCFLYWSTYP